MEQKALVIGNSGGIGRALADELVRQGYHVTGLSRSRDGLDITCEEEVSAQLSHLDAHFDRIIISTGSLSHHHGPEKSLSALSADEMLHLFAVNAVGPALVLKHAKRLLLKDRPAVIAALSARVGSIEDNGLGGWYSYRASKAALNQVIKTASIELKRTHRHLVCAALHPGTVATKFTKNYRQHKTVAPQEAAQNLLNVIDSLTPDDSGQFFDWAGKRVPW